VSATPERSPTRPDLAGRLWRSATRRVMSLKGAGMVLGILVDILVAARLGTTGTTDALVIALSVPLFVDTVTRESSNFSLVPIFIRHRSSEGPDGYQRFVSGLLNLGLLAGLVLMVGVELLAPLVIRLLGPGLPAAAHREGVDMLRIAAPMLVFAPAITLQGVLLDSRRSFTYTALRNAVAPGVVIVVLGLAWSSARAALWVAGGYSLGFLLYFLIMFAGARAAGHRHGWTVRPTLRDLADVRGAIGWPTLGFVVRQGSRFVERMLASLVAPGGVAAFYFAFRLFSASQTLVGSTVATTGLPTLSTLYARGESRLLGRSLESRILITLAITVPAAALVLVFHDPIVGLLYHRGAFGARSVQRTGRLLYWFGWGIVFLSLATVLQSALYACGSYRLVFRNMLVTSVLNAGLAWWLSRGLGLSGIAIAETVTAAVTTLNAVLLVRLAGLPVPWVSRRR